MSASKGKQVLRLRKKHAPGAHAQPQAADGEQLIRSQSLRQAGIAAFAVIIAFAIAWSMLSLALSRVFPWLTVALGLLVGLAVRRGGQGVDWRFPTLAAAMTLLGAVLGNIVVGAAFSADELGASTIRVLLNTTTMTWPIFFDEVMTIADVIFAIGGAMIAAFLANRRLSRQQYQAFRLWQDELHKEKNNYE
jgi:prepilin signal peptidase PulO-like enzyme (type II secretory pathway)